MDTAALIDRYLNRDDVQRFNAGGAHRAYQTLGCRYSPECGLHRFAVWAPNAREVSVVGDWNGWDASASPMTRCEGGVWAAFIPGITNGMTYKFRIVGADGNPVLKADPFAFYSETGPATASRVWDLGGYDWGDDDFIAARREKDALRVPMSIYELHLGSWRKSDDERYPDYRRIADELVEYCTDMGYTHVEPMPLTEYPFDGSWGYQVTGYFAPTSRYGTPQDFMYFVDRLHRAGIGVILDWVPAHFPKDEHGLQFFDGTPLFECSERRMAEHPEWGTLIFDYGKPQVQSFLISSAMFFFDTYHIDGIRMDAVTSLLYLDFGRKPGEWTPNCDGGNLNYQAIDFMQKFNTAIHAEHPDCVTIAEEATTIPLITHPPQAGGLGFTFKWCMGFMHDILEYLDMDPDSRRKNHGNLSYTMTYAFSENFILPFSHDEVSPGRKAMVEKMWGAPETKFAALRALYAVQFAHPGKKLLFMGSEFAQRSEWDYNKTIDWQRAGDPIHEAMQHYVRRLNHLYTETPALWEIEDSWDGFIWLNVDDAESCAIAFMRKAREGAAIVCACNFSLEKYDDFVIGLPESGVLRELISSDDTRFGGDGVRNAPEIPSADEPFLSFKHSARITLPAMSAVWFKFEQR